MSSSGARRGSASGTANDRVPRSGWDYNGIVGTGQSLAVGAEGTPLRATKQPYRNLKLSLGSRFLPTLAHESPKLSLVPLVEPIRPLAWSYPGPYPRNIYGETPHTCMGSQITALQLAATGGERDYVTVHSVVGESGQGMQVLVKGAVHTEHTGRAYESTLFEARAITRLARASGKTYGVGAIVLTHGESDAVNPGYAQALHDLWRDYNADLRLITGQAAAIPLLVTQQHSSPPEPGSVGLSTLAPWRASVTLPSEIICVGPKYQYTYAKDGVHLDALGYDRLGEKYGQVYFERVVLSGDWRPLAPTSAERAGKVVRVHFHVPVPPLAWDESLPPPHQSEHREWSKGRGFEVLAAGARVVIENVEIVGHSVRITCEGEPVAPVQVRYALTAGTAPRPGGTVRWGQLRDSDAFVGATTATAQSNYAVAFELVVP